MTVSSSTTSVAYTGNGSTTSFAVTFPFFGTGSSSELIVVERTIATGAEVTKDYSTHYTVTGGSNNTGTVIAGSAPADTVQWHIRRATTTTQSSDYVTNDPFAADTIENSLDRLAMSGQERDGDISQSFKYADTYTGGASVTVPEPSASKVLAWNSGANALENGPATTDISAASTNATAAASSATAAATSATAAASSATSAATSESAALAAAQGWSAVTTITGATTNLETTDARDYYIIDATSNTITINLPAIGSNDGLLYGFQVHNVDNAISIVRDGSDKINGSSSNYSGLTTVGQVIHFIADDATNDNWLATIISQHSDASATVKGIVELATDGETATGSDTARAVTPANVASAYIAQGVHTIWVPAAAMRPTVSNGCAAITDVETTSGRPDMQVLDFDASSDEHAQFQISFPKSWNEGTITFAAYWTTTGSDTDTCAWGLQGVAVSDNDTIDVAYGSAVVVTDTLLSAAEDMHVTATSGAVTIAGTPAVGDLCYFRIFRDVSADNMGEDGRLIGCKIFYTVDAKDDS